MKNKEHNQDETVADAASNNFVDRLAPDCSKPFLRLMRLDRQIGFWLLFWPCAFSVGLAAVARPALPYNWWALILFFIGAIIMRGAGCTFNDIVDRNIDKKVERTRSRPIASGQISVKTATLFLIALALTGLLILLQFNDFTVLLGASSLILVAIYPFMKRIIWWPQLFLGLAFSWGALMGWSASFGTIHLPAILLYIGCILWTIGYDTIYAMQDIEDDALIGVKSTARLFGDNARPIIALFYLGAFGFWMMAGLNAGAGTLFLTVLIVPALIFIWQIVTLAPQKTGNALQRFKANHYIGLALALAFFIEWKF